jgi:hypothetical protein
MSRQQAEQQYEDNTLGSQNSVISIMTRLWAQWSRIRIPGWKRDFSLPPNIHTGFGAQPASCYIGTGLPSPEVSGQNVTLITHPHITPKLRMR